MSIDVEAKACASQVRVLRASKILLAVAALCSISCGAKKDSGLDITITPDKPFMTAFGSGTTVSGYFQVTPGFFVLNNISLNWRGKNTLELVAIVLNSQTDKYKVNCAYAGDDLTTLFPNNRVGTNVQITASASPTPIPSVAAGCGGITMPSPIPSQFNVPIQVEAIGAVIDASNNTVGRAEATANIVVQ